MKIHIIQNKLPKEITVRNSTIRRYEEDYNNVFAPGEKKIVSANFYNLCSRKYKDIFSFEINEVEDYIPRIEKIEKRLDEMDKLLAEMKVKETPKRAYNKKDKNDNDKVDGIVEVVKE